MLVHFRDPRYCPFLTVMNGKKIGFHRFELVNFIPYTNGLNSIREPDLHITI